jgi:hypothetical protein
MNDSIDWRRIAHRWFVQYNPLYLVSAALVLLGLHLVSVGYAGRGLGSFELSLVVQGLNEGYQLALIASAALLYRIGRRRAAVMLALIEVVYLCDLTFHNGVSSMLELAGIVGSVGWWLLTIAKLRVLAWALRLRLSRGSWLTAGAGAAAIASYPHLLFARLVSPEAAGPLTGALLFAVGALALFGERAIESRDPLDAWGHTVLRRARLACFGIWGGLGVAHLLFWSLQAGVPALLGVLPALLLLFASRARRERSAWIAVAAALAWLALCASFARFSPLIVPTTMAMAAVALALRGWLGRPAGVAAARVAMPLHPYRGAASTPEAPEPAPPPRAPLGPEALRCYVGALASLHLAIWSLDFWGEGWPPHQLVLDLVFTILLALLAWRGRARLAIVPLLALWTHALATGSLVQGPSTSLGWGALLLGTGFALLAIGVAVSCLLRRGVANACAERGDPLPRR